MIRLLSLVFALAAASALPVAASATHAEKKSTGKFTWQNAIIAMNSRWPWMMKPLPS